MSITLSAVVPVYNEVDNLGPLHAELTEALAAFGRPYEIVYVDDGSTDGSFPILRTLQEQDPHVVLVRFARNFGQTAALAAGFDHASGTVVVTLGADRRHGRAIARFVPPSRGCRRSSGPGRRVSTARCLFLPRHGACL